MTHEHTADCNHADQVSQEPEALDAADKEVVALVMSRFADVVTQVTMKCMDETILTFLLAGETEHAETVARVYNKLRALEDYHAEQELAAQLNEFEGMTPDQLIAQIQDMLVQLGGLDDHEFGPGLDIGFGDGDDSDVERPENYAAMFGAYNAAKEH